MKSVSTYKENDAFAVAVNPVGQAIMKWNRKLNIVVCTSLVFGTLASAAQAAGRALEVGGGRLCG
jgi:hypothetical protein